MEIRDATKTVLFAVTDPNLLTIDLAKHEQNMAKLRAVRDAATPPPGKLDLRKEYNQLRQRLFELRQNAKHYEIRTNDAAGNIRLIEQRIDDLLKQKKAAVAEGNLRGERTFEQAIQRAETELADAKEEFEKNKRWGSASARGLKEFNQHDRIAELKAILDAPLPVTKSDRVPK